MDIFPFVLMTVNVALIVAVYAEFQGVFDIEDETSLQFASMIR
jgi:hypothetical protein